MLSCLSHDVDHRGTNNAYQRISKSPLAALYSSEGSTLERHHLTQTIFMLSSEGCTILDHLDHQQYLKALKIIKRMILSTDLAQHFARFPSIQSKVNEGSFDLSTEDNQLEFLCLCMTSCDLGQVTKPWPVARHISDLVYEEFHTQGDLEKAIGSEVIPMMDREICNAPAQQIQFIDSIALPVFEVLVKVMPETLPLLENAKLIKMKWEMIAANPESA